ncbi:hypothetical protein acsn021_12040 [Anaerocolumna cellulosilytica]|uniref:Flagellar hook-length control protein-like C-terminal domain-containing protein n=1 Tax=Anaerocolumna cellulosilytica TaxID=433286 RepID=A0A6S6R295_9FIRM|nr:flagellar hook-length control protein FliK [Anaerocolumna cellulosilytica]MBB5196061.1 hypothetical protein [Anaerocolumna cellulosilytica]BCJ93635.1 hypothetical protein acsn021_12040 [Anaerocolumna cellulosilytica]
MINQPITTGTTGKSSLSSKAASTASSHAISASASSGYTGIEKGQLLRGEVVDLRSNEVTVKLEDGSVITGRLEDNTSLSIGSRVVFSVEEVSAKTLVLKIVPGMNQTAYNTIDKALEAAGLSKTDKNKTIVRELLNQQMPIDKNTISLILKQSLQFKEVSIETLVFMNKNNLPVTEASLEFLNSMRNSENKIAAQINDLSDAISTIFQESLQDGSYSEISRIFLHKLLSPIANPPVDSTIAGQLSQKDVTDFLNYIETVPELKNVISDELLLSLKSGAFSNHDLLLLTDNFNKNIDTITVSEEFQHLKLMQAITKNLEHTLPSSEVNGQVDGMILSPLNTPYSAHSLNVNPPDANPTLPLSYEERNTLINNIRTLTQEPLPASLANSILTGESSSNEILQYIKDTLESLSSIQSQEAAAFLETAAKELLTSKEFTTLLKDELLSKWSLSPEDLKKPDAVKQLFEGLLRQLQDVKAFSEHASSTTLNAQGQVNNLQENIHFMNSLNHLFTYIQLPLKLKNQYSGGELYVYSKRKSERSTKEEGISILLHLDMTHLGPLDIYLDLVKNQLIGKFYLESTEIRDFVSSNINELEEKLIQKGYQFKTEFLTREKSIDIMEDFMNREADLKVKLPNNFDIRA